MVNYVEILLFFSFNISVVAYPYRLLIMHMKIWDSCGSSTILNPDLVFVVMNKEEMFGICTSASADYYKLGEIPVVMLWCLHCFE